MKRSGCKIGCNGGPCWLEGSKDRRSLVGESRGSGSNWRAQGSGGYGQSLEWTILEMDSSW